MFVTSRRLTEARSFGRADSVPWRRSLSRESSHLPRGKPTSALQFDRANTCDILTLCDVLKLAKNAVFLRISNYYCLIIA